MGFYRQVSGSELRKLADRAWAAGQKQLAGALHDLAREQEANERRQCAA
jgi:HD superfamily phosphohydrolase YqeK